MNQTKAWKKQPQDQAVRAFDAGAARAGEPAHKLEVEKLHAKIGQLTVEREFFSREHAARAIQSSWDLRRTLTPQHRVHFNCEGER